MKILNSKPISFCKKLNNEKEKSNVNFNALNKVVLEVSILTLYSGPIDTRSKPVKDQDNLIGFV